MLNVVCIVVVDVYCLHFNKIVIKTISHALIYCFHLERHITVICIIIIFFVFIGQREGHIFTCQVTQNTLTCIFQTCIVVLKLKTTAMLRIQKETDL